jgi:hypothetical protein
MCTLSIRPADDGAAGYDLWFNRDERLARAPETLPTRGVAADGTRHLAPADGERGGTWLMLNAHGLTVVVLNDYEAPGAAAGAVSRGRLPLVCAGCGNAGAAVRTAREWARVIGETRLGPFLMVAADAGGCTRGLGWDGRAWVEKAMVNFATSSSYRPAEVRRAREAAHARLARGAGADGGRTEVALDELHWRHDPAEGAASVRMRRPDAATRSICRVRVRGGGERMLRYTALDWTAADARGVVTEGSP